MIVSDCCKSSTFKGTHDEYPLGGTVWRIAHKATYCCKCGKECDEMDVPEEEYVGFKDGELR